MKNIKAVLTVYNSRRDMYGNVYYAMVLHDGSGKTYGFGTGYAPNLHWSDTEKLGWYTEKSELPIREFNRMIKKWPHLGSDGKEIIRNLLGGSQ